METLEHFFIENGSALWATIIGFLSVYGVTLLVLVINIIRSKLANSQLLKDLDEAQLERAKQLDAKLEALEERIIEASNINTEKRIAAMQDIADAVAAENERLKNANTTDANSMLDNLE